MAELQIKIEDLNLESVGTYTDSAPETVLHGSIQIGRRSYASRLVEAGVAIEDVSRLLGHVHLDYTLVYVSPSKDSIRRAFEVALSLD